MLDREIATQSPAACLAAALHLPATKFANRAYFYDPHWNEIGRAHV